MKITWPDGTEIIPSAGLARQFPQEMPHWSSSIWVTEDAQPYRRQLNSATGDVTWKPITLTLRTTSNGKQEFGIPTPGFLNELNLLATAWRHKKPGSTARALLIDPNQGLHASNVRWKDEEDDPEVGYFENEQWRRLDNGIQGYLISTHGRLYSQQSNQVTRGFYHKGGFWAGVKRNDGTAMLVKLTGGAASLPPALERARDAFAEGIPPWHYADANGIKEATAWGYYVKAALHVPDKREVAEDFVDPDVWSAVRDLPDEIRLGPLTDVRAQVEETVGHAVDRNELILSRLCLLEK
ncbi:hypothetical protein OAO87_00390 [bacterium]|nr:hypothetical protein [bacterium]